MENQPRPRSDSDIATERLKEPMNALDFIREARIDVSPWIEEGMQKIRFLTHPYGVKSCGLMYSFPPSHPHPVRHGTWRYYKRDGKLSCMERYEKGILAWKKDCRNGRLVTTYEAYPEPPVVTTQELIAAGRKAAQRRPES